MGAICGYIDIDGIIDATAVERMNNVAAYRGQDDHGVSLITPCGLKAYGGGALGGEPLLGALGNTSFRITDSTGTGHQPMSLDGLPVAITFNGEIYNHMGLRKELEEKGHVFHSSSDTEVLLHSYLEWGEDCLSRFVGVWSFAIWDGRYRTLFCSRDRLGAKPFYFHHSGNLFCFASTLKQLCQIPAIPRAFNLPALAMKLVFRISDYNDESLIDSVNVLLPGHNLKVRLAQDMGSIAMLEDETYWRCPTEIRQDWSFDQWKTALGEVLSDSCRLCLRGNAPTTALLSGGLDSSCMVTELCGQMENPGAFQTFTTSYPGRNDCDEWAWADKVNKNSGCKGNRIVPEPSAQSRSIEELFEDIAWYTEGIGDLAFLGPYILLRQIREAGFKVVLNGQGSDEALYGYLGNFSFFFSELLRQRRYSRCLSEFKQASSKAGQGKKALIMSQVYLGMPWIRKLRNKTQTSKYVASEVVRALDKETLGEVLRSKSLEDFTLSEVRSFRTIARNDDGLFTSASLESRMPFADHRFFELAASMPLELKFRNGYTKSMLREVFDGRMPKEVTWRTNKMGFSAPTDRWAADFSKDYIRDRVKSSALSSLFKKDALLRLVDTAPTSRDLFLFLQTDAFARRFGLS